MFQVANETPFPTERAVLLDKEANQFWVVIIKGTYNLTPGGPPGIDPVQEPVQLAPLYEGECGRSSLLREVEMTADHPGTDVTLNAAAHAPNAEPVAELEISVSIGSLAKKLKVIGDRIWEKGPRGLRATNPISFTTMPIRYEKAFGGTTTDPKTGAVLVHPQNPIGRGFAQREEQVAGKPLPNIFDPGDSPAEWNERPRSVGFGAIPPLWQPRLAHAGTFDDQWKRNKMPLWPDDFDARFHRSAPPELSTEDPLKGGEKVTLVNLCRIPVLSFRLPEVSLTAETVRDHEWFSHPVNLDRVIIEPDRMKLIMVWRAALNCGNRVRGVVQTSISQRSSPNLPVDSHA